MTDYSTPLYDEVNLVEDYPDTIPWCPEEDVAGVVPMVGAGMDSIIPKSHRLPRVAYGNFTTYAQNGTGFGPTNVGFPVNAVIVSNWTPQWAKVSGEWIPPFSINGVIRMPSATPSASVSWEAPPGFTQPATTSGALLKAVFCEEPLSPKSFSTLESAIGGGADATTLNTGQVSITTAATLIKAANTARRTITVKNPVTNGAAVFLGTSTETATTGHELDPGDAITFSNYTGALYGITAAVTETVTFAEESA